MSFTTRTAKRGFFTDSTGTELVQFQFNPERLPLQESVNINARNQAGRADTDLLWVSGRPDDLIIDLFIDRTVETRTGRKSGVSTNEVLRPRIETGLFSSERQLLKGKIEDVRDVVDILRGKQNTYTPPETLATDYVVNPDLDPNDAGFNENIGVYAEYGKFRRFIKPKDYTMPKTFSKADVYRVANASRISLTARTFVPPPVAILFFGDMWVEGYFESLRPVFQLFNKGLIPMRMELSVTMLVHQIGFLTPTTMDHSNTRTSLGGHEAFGGYMDPNVSQAPR